MDTVSTRGLIQCYVDMGVFIVYRKMKKNYRLLFHSNSLLMTLQLTELEYITERNMNQSVDTNP